MNYIITNILAFDTWLSFQQTKKNGEVNSSSHTRFNISGLLKIQTLLKVRQGQYKNFLLQ